MSFDGGQLAAARALHKPKLDIRSLATEVGMSTTTISQFERGKQNMSRLNRDKIALFFKNRGVRFTDTGVERERGYQILRGRDGFVQLYEQLFDAAQQEGADLCLHNGVSSLVIDALGQDYVERHKERMKRMSDCFRYRAIVEQGDNIQFGSSYAEYKFFPSNLFIDKTKYIFGSKLAYVDFEGEIEIILINNQKIADSERTAFNLVWDYLAKDPPDGQYD